MCPDCAGLAIGNFAFDPHVAESAFEQLADLLSDLADLPYVALGHQIEKRSLAHGV